ncbi:MAG TPA: molybdopterin cofactor-binding domain-containing protein, partial [Gemmataceae bacterium]
IDPLVIRRKNIPPNDPKAAESDPNSWPALRHTIYSQELDIAAKLAGWAEKWHPPGQGPRKRGMRHGIGMALHTWGGFASGAPNECTVRIGRDGSVTALSSTQDLGTGQRTVTAIVVAEVLGLSPADVITQVGESDLGRSSGSGGSTTCPSQAPAALLAATAARDDLFAKVGKKLGADPANLKVEEGKVTDTRGGKSWSWKEFCARLGTEEARGTGEWSAGIARKPDTPQLSSGQVGGVQVVELWVDDETGVVRLEHIVAVQDCGLVVNKLTCESQVAGGVIMGLNYALFEERILDPQTGRQTNADMEFYKLANITDVPKITVHMLDMPQRGVIGIGEPPTVSTAAAVGNAIFNAIGVRVPYAPYTPERVLEALAKGGNV